MVHSSLLGPASDGHNQGTPRPPYGTAGVPNALEPVNSGDEAAIASEARYRSLFDASPDAIILTDLQTRILMCNQQAAALWGPGSAESLIGRNAFEFIVPEDHERAMANAQKTLAVGSVHSIEYTLLREDGSRFPAELSASLIVDHQGAPQAFTAVVRDITDRKRLEAELRQSEKLRSLGVMAAGVAHHINNVLAAVLGQADLLLETTRDATTRQRLETIVRSAQDGASAVHRIKQFAYDQPSETCEQIDLARLVRDAVDATEPRWRDEASLHGRTIEVAVTAPGPVWTVGVPAELREALTNIVLNAVDALPAGGRIAVELATDAEDAVVRVTDNGTGMSDEVRGRVYDPFFTTKPLGQGTGLGLAVTYGIVHRHGGSVGVTSEPGRGTTVEIRLPAAPSAQDPGEPTVLLAPIRGLRILVVDDDPVLAEQLYAILSLDRHRVRICHSGADAISVLRDEAFDVVITDLGMPEVNGWGVASEAKACLPGAIVGLITGWADQVVDLDDRRKRCIDFVIAKPYRVQTIRETLAAAFSPRPMTGG
jgi:PAS domain S-box-containing protein